MGRNSGIISYAPGRTNNYEMYTYSKRVRINGTPLHRCGFEFTRRQRRYQKNGGGMKKRLHHNIMPVFLKEKAEHTKRYF